jgi:subtilisin-like proprotein convertase family protein
MSCQSITFTSGPINVHVPDNSATGAAHSITLYLPAGAVIYNIGVTINFSHTYMGDIDINLKAPNGYVLNLFNVHGGSGDNLVNTVISSQGTNAFSTGVAPFTGTFRATGSLNRGPTGYLSNVQSFAQLYSVPSGTWTLALVDSLPVDVGPLTRWDITFDVCNSTNSGPPTNAPTFKPTAIQSV